MSQEEKCSVELTSAPLDLCSIILPPQLKDSSFRRHVLVQCLILFDYLKVTLFIFHVVGMCYASNFLLKNSTESLITTSRKFSLLCVYNSNLYKFRTIMVI